MNELEGIEKNLWTGVADSDGALLRQYELYVRQAEAISARRHAVSMIMLGFTVAFLVAAVAFEERLVGVGRVVFFAGAIGVQAFWFLLARSYRNLNSAKYKVVGLMEKRLPTSPFWAAEWKALGEGRDWRKYIPVSAIEHTAPLAFVALFAYMAFA